MARIISPARRALASLDPPLQPGERRIFELFEASLSNDWEIYVQPHLNGCRPDFVLLHPEIGIGVFEIKDWDLHPDRYVIRRDARGYAGVHLLSDGEDIPLRSPLDQLMMYRREIFELYYPRLERPSDLSPVIAGVVFPFAREERVADVLSRLPESRIFTGADSVAWGMESIERNAPAMLFSQLERASPRLMNVDLANDLRSWLIEPAAVVARRETVRLDARQTHLVRDRTPSGFRRIRGPAGSGKSLVLALRAARLAADGKSVLVVTFNITLAQYLRDLCRRDRDADPNRVTWFHFHGWCKRLACELGFLHAYNSLWGPYGGGLQDLPKLVLDELRSREPEDKALYDAILVDEGQDFDPLWWTALRETLKPGGEMLLAADITQDTYDMAHAWTENVMTGAGFSGRWNDLPLSYRLPLSLIPLAAEFAEMFLPRGKRIVPVRPPPEQGELDLSPCALRWIQTPRLSVASVCCEEALRAIRLDDERNHSMNDVTILVDTVPDGRAVERNLDALKIRTTTTFARYPSSDARSDQQKKLAFSKGDGRVKITTLHSFKGWETRLLTLCITKATTLQNLNVIYTGLTRLKRHPRGSQLTVVCSVEYLRAFGRLWPEFEDRVPRQ